MSWILGAIGGFVLFLYGIIPTFQKTNEAGDECKLIMDLHQFLWAGKSVLHNSKYYILQFLFWYNDNKNLCKPTNKRSQ